MKPTDIKRNGEGLPLVGEHCEIEYNADKWIPVSISAYTDQSVVVENLITGREECISREARLNFRPLQSHRDRVIEKARGYTRANADALEVIDDLYDAGMLVDSQPKRMTRDDAYSTLCEELPVLATGHILRILDALGFTEDGE